MTTKPFTATLSASGNVGTPTFAITSGALPAGLSLNGATGDITGTPTATGSFSYTVTATDAYGSTGSSALGLTIYGDNTKLISLVTTGLTLSPVFDNDATEGYTVGGVSSSMTITPTAADSAVTIEATVNGGSPVSITSGSPSSSLTLADGDVVDLKITARNGSTVRHHIMTRLRNGFSPTASLLYTHDQHLATRLNPSGKVLVAGGAYDNFTGQYRSELYTYASGTGSWAAGATAGLLDPDFLFGLPSGNSALIVSGQAGGKYSAGSFNFGFNYAYPQYQTSSVMLPSGLILVTGGYGGAFYTDINEVKSCFVGGVGIWTYLTPMNAVRKGHTVDLVTDGSSVVKVLAVGGSDNGSILPSAETYDIALDTWTYTATTMSTARTDHTSTVLPNGTVLIVGGQASGTALAGTEIYDPVNDTWTTMPSMNVARVGHTATLVTNSASDTFVLVTGGENASGTVASAELFDTATGNWRLVGSLTDRRTTHSATLLSNGLVLIAGGTSNLLGIYFPSTILTSCELFDVNAVTP